MTKLKCAKDPGCIACLVPGCPGPVISTYTTSQGSRGVSVVPCPHAGFADAVACTWPWCCEDSMTPENRVMWEEHRRTHPPKYWMTLTDAEREAR